jgi:glyoxylase-like metal-dependent hydrolase (beta-lactamase superfamily II)
MKVHHLKCLTMCPPLGKLLVNPEGRLVCHVLLIETDDGLVLVDTGLGVDDLADPRRRMGGGFVFFTRLSRDPAQSAAAQVERLGFQRSDVRHIICTHLDLDHGGGIADFPHAKVHIHARELDAAQQRATWFEKERYRPHQWQGAQWVPLEPAGGEMWFGFDAVRPFAAHGEILLVPLEGHTRGHSGVAVRGPSGWLLHAGDAYFHRDEMDAERPRGSLGLDLFQWLDDMDRPARKRNQQRLRELARDHASEVQVFCAHDPVEYDRFS